ncbi:MAG: hypothetical protein ACM3JD_16740 [Rudaea sp.]
MIGPSFALTLGVVVGIYGLIIAGFAYGLRKLRVADSSAVFSGFILFGLITGILAVVLWPMDISVYPNVLASWVGEWVYVHSIELIGDPHSAQAGYTIPWVLRVPQVYAFTSMGLCAGLGLAAQWLYNRHPRRRISRGASA